MKAKLEGISKKYWLIGLFVLIVVHLYLLSRLIFFPYPELFIYSYLTEEGLTPYKQIFDQHFPGIMFFPVNLASFGIDTPSEARILHLAVVGITQILIFLVARKLFRSNLLALTSTLLYLIWQPFFEGYVLWIDTLVVPFLLLAFYFLIGKKKKLFYSGLFLGTALLFKQVVGPLAVLLFIYLYADNKRFRKVLPFIAGFLIPVFLLILWVARLSIWREFLFWSVTFNLTTFAQMGRKYPALTEIIKALPLFAIAILTLVREVKKKAANPLILLSIFLLGTLFFAYARFDLVHLQPAVPFAAISTVFLMKRVEKDSLRAWLGIYLVAALLLLWPFYRSHLGDRVLFFGEFESKLSERVLQNSNLGDTIFALGTTPHIYQLTKTLPPGNVFVFQFPWFMVEAEERILQGIITDPPKVVLRDEHSTVQGMNLVSFMPKINAHIERYYKVIDNVNGTEIMVRN